MLSTVKRFGFWLVCSGLLIFPFAAAGQDLGSSTGLFRASNPATKKSAPAAEKKSAPKTAAKKPAPKPAVAKTAPKKIPSKTVSKSKPDVARNSAATPPAQEPVNRPSQANVILTVGKPNENIEALFEQNIE